MDPSEHPAYDMPDATDHHDGTVLQATASGKDRFESKEFGTSSITGQQTSYPNTRSKVYMQDMSLRNSKYR